MEIEFSSRAKAELEEWKLAGKTLILQKIRELMESIQITPYTDIGKPEGLKHQLVGKWSRRITKADRLVYEVKENKLLIYSLKGHY